METCTPALAVWLAASPTPITAKPSKNLFFILARLDVPIQPLFIRIADDATCRTCHNAPLFERYLGRRYRMQQALVLVDDG